MYVDPREYLHPEYTKNLIERNQNEKNNNKEDKGSAGGNIQRFKRHLKCFYHHPGSANENYTCQNHILHTCFKGKN